jgi:CYTH domain-containing protein
MQHNETLVPTPKYSHPEIERRWLVHSAFVSSLADCPYRDIEDLYVESSQLRLRKAVAPDGSVERKLCKKYGRGIGLSEPITNLYLSVREYEILRALPGNVLRKRRYSYYGGALDVFADRNLVLFEVEFSAEVEARNYTAPPFAEREVTDDEAYTGSYLATHAT